MSDIGNNISRTSSPFSPGSMPSGRATNDASTRNSVDAVSPSSSRISGDPVDVSKAAQWLLEMDRLPSIRADKVAAAKAAINNGTFDTDAQLAVSVERMIDDIM